MKKLESTISEKEKLKMEKMCLIQKLLEKYYYIVVNNSY